MRKVCHFNIMCTFSLPLNHGCTGKHIFFDVDNNKLHSFTISVVADFTYCIFRLHANNHAIKAF